MLATAPSTCTRTTLSDHASTKPKAPLGFGLPQRHHPARIHEGNCTDDNGLRLSAPADLTGSLPEPTIRRPALLRDEPIEVPQSQDPASDAEAKTFTTATVAPRNSNTNPWSAEYTNPWSAQFQWELPRAEANQSKYHRAKIQLQTEKHKLSRRRR